jgi:excisionase family DNA binding protein
MTSMAGSVLRSLNVPIEAARVLHVDAPTVRRMVRAGDLPAVRVGGQWRLDPDTVERLVAGRRQARKAWPKPPRIHSSSR